MSWKAARIMSVFSATHFQSKGTCALRFGSEMAAAGSPPG
jgi:hypothetical protein